MSQRVADDLRLLVDLFRHEMAVIAFFGQQAARLAADRAATDDLAAHVPELRSLAGHDDPVAFFEIGDLVREGGKRERVGAKIHLAFAVSDCERRALPRSNQEVFLALKQEHERESAAHALQGRVNRLGRRLSVSHFRRNEERGDFGVRLRREIVTATGKLFPERFEILNNAVVHDGKCVAGVRMRVGLRWLAMGGPTRMPNSDGSAEGDARKFGLEIFQLALGADSGETAVFKSGDARGVITAVFEPLQRRYELRRS